MFRASKRSVFISIFNYRLSGATSDTGQTFEFAHCGGVDVYRSWRFDCNRSFVLDPRRTRQGQPYTNKQQDPEYHFW